MIDMKTFSHLRINGAYDCHVQGIAIDRARKYMYFSFTTCLVKTDLQGNIIGSVNGIAGHLGCLAYNYQDGRVYGSLEYKNDSIGNGIKKAINSDAEYDDGFYIAIFDVNKITEPDMDAEKDRIMTSVYLKEVAADYSAKGHKYGCSGIDGITFAPKPGENEGNYLYVAYGIYGDTKRKDNNHQILLQYNPETLKQYEHFLNLNNMHTYGPETPENKYFVYTGNTTYGIQNLEYDKENNCLFAAVYKGRKLRFPNYLMYATDICRPEQISVLRGLNETGKLLPLKKFGFFRSRFGISGCDFPYGSTGMIYLGNGNFLFSEEFRNENGNGTDIFSYRLYPDKGFVKEDVIL